MAVLPAVGQLVVCDPLLPNDTLKHWVARVILLPSDEGGAGVEGTALKDDIMIILQVLT
jgi:hypothetical protein